MHGRLIWDRDGHDWPNRASSRFVEAAGLRWHVQVTGRGPGLLLLHGTGAATHSWRALLPLLAADFTVVAPDLPGHGFSAPMPDGRPSLPGVAAALGELLRVLGMAPALAAGHSAGAAIAVQMALQHAIEPRAIVALNGALLPFHGWAGMLFAPMARLLVRNRLVPRLFSWRAHDRAAVHRLIDATGSTIDAEGLAWYGRLVRSPAHVAGALGMMANWDLDAFARALPRLRVPLLLVVGDRDRTVPPAQAGRVAAAVAQASIVTLRGLGHLAHEEQPQRVAQIVRERLSDSGAGVAHRA